MSSVFVGWETPSGAAHPSEQRRKLTVGMRSEKHPFKHECSTEAQKNSTDEDSYCANFQETCVVPPALKRAYTARTCESEPDNRTRAFSLI